MGRRIAPLTLVVASFFSLLESAPAGHPLLLQLSEQIKAQMEADRTQALILPAKHNWPIRIITHEETIIELQGLIHGRPLYYITHKRDAAETITTDKIWPSGRLGFALTGETQTIGM